MELRRSKQFDKQFLNLDKKIQLKVIEQLNIFSVNPFDQLLNNHALMGTLKGTRSLNVTGDYRIHFRDINGNYELIELIKVGTHSQLYG